MQFDFQPYEGAGALRFGMTPEKVKKVLGDPDERLVRNKYSEMLGTFEYLYNAIGLHIHFNWNDSLDSISFMAPASLTFREKDLMSVPFYELRDWIRDIDPAAEDVEDPDIQSNLLGITTYSPNAEDDPSEPAESIMIFKREYFEDWDRRRKEVTQ